MSWAVGDRLEHAGVKGTVTGCGSGLYRVVWDDGMRMDYAACDMARLARISAAPTLQVGDVVEITDHAHDAIWAGYGVHAEAPFTVKEVLSYGVRIRDGSGRQFWVDKTRISTPATPAEPTCTCSARGLVWNGHRCGLANSDPWRALAAVFQ